MSAEASEMQKQMGDLSVLALELLPSMIDPASGLFAQKAVRSREGLRRIGVNPLYSAISLIGMNSPSSFSVDPGISLDSSVEALARQVLGGRPSPGLLGTTMWAFALLGDVRTETAVERLELRFQASDSPTADLGLVLAGLAAVHDAFPDLRKRVAALAESASTELLARFSDHARLFRTSSFALRPRRLALWKSTTFAAQVYPVLGLAQYARSSETSPPPQIVKAAEQLIETQGPLGQWWWIYSSHSGAVIDGYPVYSVHQDAMAFMALASVQNLGLGSYQDALARGLDWLFGKNELGKPLVDLEQRFVSRCIQRSGGLADGLLGMSPGQQRALILSLWGLRRSPGFHADPSELEILEECRSYHLGWVLYARSLVRDW